MGGKRCIVSGCTNSQSNSKGKDIIYHSFPKENAENREKWISACSSSSVFNWNSQSAAICSEHFTSHDYTRDLRSELMNVPAKRRLRAEGITTFLFLNFKYFIINFFFCLIAYPTLNCIAQSTENNSKDKSDKRVHAFEEVLSRYHNKKKEDLSLIL